MKFMLNLSTRVKLALGFGLILALLIAVALTAYNGIVTVKESQKRLKEQAFQNALDCSRVDSNENGVRASTLAMMLSTNKAEQEISRQDIADRAKEITALLKGLSERNNDNPEFASKLREFDTVRDAYGVTRDTQVIPSIQQGNLEKATQLLAGIQRDRFLKMRDLTDRLEQEAKDDASQMVATSEKITQAAVRNFTIFSIVAAGLGILIVLLLNSSIANPLKEVSDVAAQIAEGDLAVNITSENRRDEVGVLRQNFARMAQSLRSTADVARQITAGDLRVKVTPQSEKDVLGNAFAKMVENLRSTTNEITQGINILATSASQISTSTTQVAAGAAETATAVTETTTTVEEVKQTAQVSSQKAKYVSDSAQRATQVAQTGKKSVEISLEGMHRIQNQMQSIAESIVKLSEQSQAIGEIVAAVNDLAEQSNLLAVNAAIEAAKAGEHGKGFGVVAQEIKSLAEQSKQATGQIRGILGEIQKATSAAVMTTEQGSKAVDAGTKLSAEAGESIRVLADSINEAAQAATQIAASSQQQLVGMDQVAMAMDNIKQASNQNVAGIKQTEAAAHNLQELGQRLKRLVDQYKI